MNPPSAPVPASCQEQDLAMQRFLRAAALLLVLLFPTALLQAAPGVKVHPQQIPNPVAYQRLDWVVELDRAYTNPFDPEEISVKGVFTGPDGQSLELPAFWSQEFQRATNAAPGEGPLAVGAPHWLVRFAPSRAGQWTLQVLARDQSGEGNSALVRFKVAPGISPGFVRRCPTNPRYFQFDSGAPYFLVGFILGWGHVDEYESMLNKLADAGGNYTRIWISPPNPVLETRQAGLGRYDLLGAWHYEQILDLAQRRGIYVMLTIKNYRDLKVQDVWGPAPWPSLPYNKTNGGPAARPADFFTDPLARKMYQRHLRYLIARYSAFTSLAFWEFWNEQDNMDLGSIAPWIKEMAAYLKKNDPYRHLVTTSYGAAGEPEVWQLPAIDFTQRHFYGDEGSVHDVVPAVWADARAHDAFAKPHLMSELGISWRRSDNDFDPGHTGANLHSGLWASAFAGNAGGATIWWWYDYIQPHDMWGQLTPLARFAKNIDWPRVNFKPIVVDSPTFNVPQTAAKSGDIVLTAAWDWGKAEAIPRAVGPDGLVSWTLPTFLYGPLKPDLRTKLTLQVNLSKSTRVVVRAARASRPCQLQVSIDSHTVAEFSFHPQPEPVPAKDGPRSGAIDPLYAVATADRDREVVLPEGSHALTLDLVEGDWLTLESITLIHARAPQGTGLQPLALADPSTGETIAWIHDPNSNWYSDSRQIPPAQFENFTLSLPVAKGGRYKVDWWDTYKGDIVRTDTVKAEANSLTLSPPAFRRDIALHVVLEKKRGRS